MLIELREVGWKSFSVFGILLMHNRHEVVCRVIELGTFETESKIEIIGCLLCCSMVDESALDHQNEMVEKSIDIWVRLMNGHYHSFVLLTCHIRQILYDNEWSEWVKPWGRFIQNDDLWITDELKGNRGPLSFSSRDTFDELASHNDI